MSAHALSHQEKVRIYFKVFFALFVITILEVGATFIPGHKIIRDTIICLLACTKAGAVGYYYMHLNHEKKWLRIVAVLPIFMLVYAAVLIPDTIHDRPTATYLPIRPRVFPVHEKHDEHADHGDEVPEELAPPVQAEAPAADVAHPEEAPVAPAEAAPSHVESAPAAAPAAPAAPEAAPAAGGAADEWR